MLPPGRYTLTVKKPGFFEEVRSVEVKARGKHRMTINLRPEMAILSLNSNIADAEIEIEGTGKFRGQVKKQLLKPDKYRIQIRRRGYESQTVTADLTVPGREQNFYVVLKPMRIDSVLSHAFELLAKGDLDGASLLSNDVLLMNAGHARANMLRGLIEMRRGNHRAAGYFLKAINGGETVSLPAKTVFANQLTDVEIAINRDTISFRSSTRLDLNFRITRSNLEELNRPAGGNATAYVTVKGESDFFGRDIHPNLKIFSEVAVFDHSTAQVVCGAASNCNTDVEILFSVIASWRTMTSPTASK
jgi:hypothetical protein